MDADQGIVMSVIQCFLYPWCLCILRKSTREQKGIDVGFFYIVYKQIHNVFSRFFFHLRVHFVAILWFLYVSIKTIDLFYLE